MKITFSGEDEKRVIAAAVFVWVVAGVLLLILNAMAARADHEIPINVRVDNTSVRFSDRLNNQSFPLSGFDAVIAWTTNNTPPCTTDQTIANLSTILNTRCTNLTIGEIKDTVNERLDTRLSEFQDNFDVKINPIIDYGDRFRVCADDVVRLNRVIDDTRYNRTVLENQIENEARRNVDLMDNYEWSRYINVGQFIVILVFGLFFLGGFDKLKNWVGGRY